MGPRTQGIHLKYMPQWPWVAMMTPGAVELRHDHSSYELFCLLLRVSIAKRKKNDSPSHIIPPNSSLWAQPPFPFYRMHVCVKSLSRVWLFATPWTVTHQAPLSMGFSRQEYWSALPFPSPGDLPNPGIEPRYPALQADALSSEPPGKPYRMHTNSHFTGEETEVQRCSMIVKT